MFSSADVDDKPFFPYFIWEKGKGTIPHTHTHQKDKQTEIPHCLECISGDPLIVSLGGVSTLRCRFYCLSRNANIFSSTA